MPRLALATFAVLLAVSAPAAAGPIQDLLDKGFRVVGVSPGQQQDPIIFLGRDSELVACRSYIIIRQQVGQPQCAPVK
ncbi:hypothetical protein [Ancylobacter terrae]|uniref:hypothetical protein n=1 Tax=Ancylobacter sp. sgz301288 TaxID=3342077 RepID=UPI00385819B3